MLGREPKTGVERLDGSADDRTLRTGAVIAAGQVETAVEGVCGFGAAQVDQPGKGIGAVAGCLWTTQHLDLIQIVERADGAQAAEIDVID